MQKIVRIMNAENILGMIRKQRERRERERGEICTRTLVIKSGEVIVGYVCKETKRHFF